MTFPNYSVKQIHASFISLFKKSVLITVLGS